MRAAGLALEPPPHASVSRRSSTLKSSSPKLIFPPPNAQAAKLRERVKADLLPGSERLMAEARKKEVEAAIATHQARSLVQHSNIDMVGGGGKRGGRRGRGGGRLMRRGEEGEELPSLMPTSCLPYPPFHAQYPLISIFPHPHLLLLPRAVSPAPSGPPSPPSTPPTPRTTCTRSSGGRRRASRGSSGI